MDRETRNAIEEPTLTASVTGLENNILEIEKILGLSFGLLESADNPKTDVLTETRNRIISVNQRLRALIVQLNIVG